MFKWDGVRTHVGVYLIQQTLHAIRSLTIKSPEECLATPIKLGQR
jgi:hypothetical protein